MYHHYTHIADAFVEPGSYELGIVPVDALRIGNIISFLDVHGGWRLIKELIPPGTGGCCSGGCHHELQRNGKFRAITYWTRGGMRPGSVFIGGKDCWEWVSDWSERTPEMVIADQLKALYLLYRIKEELLQKGKFTWGDKNWTWGSEGLTDDSGWNADIPLIKALTHIGSVITDKFPRFTKDSRLGNSVGDSLFDDVNIVTSVLLTKTLSETVQQRMKDLGLDPRED